MKEAELRTMISFVDALVSLAERNPWGTHLKRHLIPVKVELERQLAGGQ